MQRLWGTLYDDDAGILWRSSEGLERMMTAFVTACSALACTVSEAKTWILCQQTNGGGKVSCTTNGAGELFKQTVKFVLLRGATAAEKKSASN